MKPETKLLSKLYNQSFEDEDLYESRGGVTLKEAILTMLISISKSFAHRRPSFSPRVIRLMSLRYGLEDGQSRTLREVGLEFNLTQERIRQMEWKILRMLLHPSSNTVLKNFIKRMEA